jgi:hypothetical protein
VALIARLVPSICDATVDLDLGRVTVQRSYSRADELVDRLALVVGRHRQQQTEIHQRRVLAG